jgi:mono/diheme cytochrome c family protein
VVRLLAVVVMVVHATLAVAGPIAGATVPAPSREFFEKHCVSCHDADTKEGGLDLTAVSFDASGASFPTWVRVHDRIAAGEMPPVGEDRPAEADIAAITTALDRWLIATEAERIAVAGRALYRRLTAQEYESALRDLLALPELSIKRQLPADDFRHGYEKLGESLDLSPVHLAKYMDAAEAALRQAVATRAAPPPVYRKRVYPTQITETWNWLARGDAVLLKDKQHDPYLPLPDPERNAFEGPERAARGKIVDALTLRDYEGTVGVFSGPVDNDWRFPLHFAPVHAGRYRVRLSAWSFLWSQGRVEPAPRTESFMLSLWLPEPGPRFPQSPSRPLGMFDAPSIESRVIDFTRWMEVDEELLFEVGTLTGFGKGVGRWVSQEKGSTSAYVGPGIAIDWLEVEGPLYESWPPESHRRLFADLPLASFDAKASGRPPHRDPVKQIVGHAFPSNRELSKEDTASPLVSVATTAPEADAARLLAVFMPLAFRRVVTDDEVRSYAALATARLAAGDCFEDAMVHAYKAVLCSHDFLFVNTPRLVAAGGDGDDFKSHRRLTPEGLATRLSLWLWDSLPDEQLLAAARSGALDEPATLSAEMDRMIGDPKFDRFASRFLEQWLDLRKLDDTQPDRRMYPEYRHILRASMAEESRAFFKELVSRDLPVSNIVASEFAMLNRTLADHYGIPGVEGCELRRVPLPAHSLRGGLITQASVLKVTANGTTTSPVPRGVFFMERILGDTIPPPPGSVKAIDPDTRGATTIREQLAKHSSDASCAACHRTMDPPGFALESFDVIGGRRDRYRTFGGGDPAGVEFAAGWKPGYRLGKPVDPSGQLADGRAFADIDGLRGLLLADSDALVRSFVKQILMYATGTDIHYSDRRAIERIVAASREHGHGLRGLLHEIAASRLFRGK